MGLSTGIGIGIGFNRDSQRRYYVSNSSELSAITLHEGDTIYLKKGETFDNFTLNIAVDNITIDSYGTGDNPILTGSEVIAAGDWTSEGGGVYSIAKAGVKWLYMDDAIVENAKTNYIQAVSYPAANQIQVSAGNTTYLDGFTDLVGKKLRVFRDGNYKMSYEYEITAYSSGLITLNMDLVGTTGTNYFFIYNYDEFLANEKWSWDGTTLKLQTALTVADHTVRVSTVDNGIYVTGNNCTIQNVTFKHFQRTAIKCYNKTINVFDCTIHDMRGNAVYIYGNSAVGTVNGNTIYNIGNSGIHFGAVASGTADDNIIYNISTGVDIGWPITDAFLNVPAYPILSNLGTTDDVSMICGNGIIGDFEWTETYTLPDSLVITNNAIHDVGYGGVKLVGDNHTVEDNHIYGWGGVWDDIQAIGLYAGPAASFPDASCKNISIKQNILHTPARLVAWSTIIPNTRCEGIYCDYGSQDADLDGNVIYDGGTIGTNGIFFYDYNTDIRVFNNIVNDYGNLALNGMNSVNITNLKIYDNIFYSTKATVLAIYASYYSAGGYLDRHTYIDTNYSNCLKLSSTSYALAAWTAATGQDANSEYLIFRDSAIYTNPTSEAVLTAIDVGYKNIEGNDISSTTLQPFTAILVFKKSTLLTGLVDYWKLDEANGDAAGINGNILTNYNTVTFEAGKIGNAASLGTSNTDKKLSKDSAFGMTYQSERSFMGWVNIINIPASGDFNFGLISLVFATNLGNHSVLIYRRLGANLQLAMRAQTYNVTLTPGTWYHIAVTWDHAGNVSKAYLNSVLRLTADSFSGDYTAYASRFSIGNFVDVQWSSAMYDEAGLWNKVLTQTEVTYNYKSGVGRTHPFD